jgi:Icc-related predicted phosphoesterase
MKKLIIMSDLHQAFSDFVVTEKNIDILISTGDVTNSWKGMEGVIEFLDWFEKIESKYKIIVAGNGDGVFIEKKEKEFIKMCEKRNIIYLRDNFVTIENYKIYGTPWTMEFGKNDGYTKKTDEELSEIFQSIPNDTNILLTHSAPLNILDINSKGQHTGSKSLSENINNVSLHCFGHIHESRGTLIKNKTIFINSAYSKNTPYIIHYINDLV